MSATGDSGDSGVDPLEAIFNAMSQQKTASSSSGGGAVVGRMAPVNIGWSLEIPSGDPVELNIVSLYKSQRFIVHQDHQTQGWVACRAIDNLKRDISSNPTGTATARLEQYIGALAMIHEHVATNDRPYRYNKGRLASPMIDFELYMMLATMAARDASSAMTARRLQTEEGYVIAFDHYMHAAQVLDETLRELCKKPAPRDRVHYGQVTEWLPLVGPGSGAPVAKIIALMGARANLLRCEAYVCAHRLIETLGVDDVTAETLDGTAAFVAQKFAEVMHAVARERKSTEPRTRMELYASFMSSLFRLLSVARLAQVDLTLAEDELSAVYLARSLRRLDRSAFPVTTQEEWSVVDADIASMMKKALSGLDTLRARAETLRSQDTTGAFVLLDLVSANTLPAPIESIDPSFALGQDDAPPDTTQAFSLRALRNRVASDMPELLSFLELRVDQKRALAAIHANPALPSVPSAHGHGRNVADGILAMFAAQLARRNVDPQWRALVQQRIGDVNSFLDILGAAFALGRLGERLAWSQFMFSTEDPVAPDDPPSDTTREIEAVNAALLAASKYFVDLGQVLDLKPL